MYLGVSLYMPSCNLRLSLAGLFLAALVPVHAKPRAQHVFIISFDGGKPAVMKKSRMPHLFSVARNGAHTWNARSVMPSITLVNHTSMLTGVKAVKHQIFWNDWQPKKGLVTVPTVFGIAKDELRGKPLVTALFAGKEKFKHLNIPGTLDKFSYPGYEASKVAKEAAQYILEQKPNLCFIHFSDGDGAGHGKGWGTLDQRLAFGDADEALEVVMDAIGKAGIRDSSVVILSADHGGHNKGHGSASLEDRTIPWIVWGRGVKRGYEITGPVSTCDTAATALWLLDLPRPAFWDGKPVEEAFVP